MAAFCGMHYDELKSVVNLTCTFPDGLNIREGIELQTNLIRKLENGQSATFAGETFRARDGSVRIRLQDGSGFGSIYPATGVAFLSAPAQVAVETTTDSPTVSTVVVRVRNHRFLASYRTALKKLGFTSSDNAPATYPAILSFDHPVGVDRAKLLAVFEPLVQAHIAKFYGFPKPKEHPSEEWYRYELWMEYKKEISIFAD